eukprot:gnl/MRDRNA2_/MRDRNA2_121388_c0_seq1.p1 gnl/MRDRNA2_/MRDRNA2_121388_c0~~gnl/MRDRNA2_/MRDRNA2_121388_c0_seq1.p1  ORF type:complete len:329 (-),score=44.15 gnl/MRDRNA2_/MRDRNA2_121388_c0_seq1:36-1022(-)
MVRFVYRAIRQDEQEHYSDGIFAKNPNGNAAIHNAVGRNTPSQYIHCTASPYVALYYAEAFKNTNSYQRIIAIDLKNAAGDVTDLSTEDACQQAGIRHGTKAWNFATRHQVVLVSPYIDSEHIIGHLDTERLHTDRSGCSSAELIDCLPYETSKNIADWVAYLVPPCTENNAHHATFSDDYVFASGTHKNVYEGRCTKGKHAGFPCVVKIAKDKRVMDAIFWQTDLKAVDKAQKIIAAFHGNWRDECHACLNQPTVWTIKSGPRKGQKNLTEPMIMGDYQKFNSNSGYADSDDFMQALSHFSYHWTKGDALICDLQGSIYGHTVKCLA